MFFCVKKGDESLGGEETSHRSWLAVYFGVIAFVNLGILFQAFVFWAINFP